MTINELGAICLGRGPCSEAFWPDIDLSDPPTDEQKLAVGELADRATKKDPIRFIRALGSVGNHREAAIFYNWAGLPLRLKAAIDTLCPDEHREAWERMKK